MAKSIAHTEIFKAIHRSQHCQRNWDLTRTIPAEDIELIKVAGTQCPSKQNISYFRLHFVTNREKIEELHTYTMGAVMWGKNVGPGPLGGYNPMGTVYTNPQTLANLLIVFERKTLEEINSVADGDTPRNGEVWKKEMGIEDEDALRDLERDANIALGISSGYINLVSNLLGYSTGCCQCMEPKKIRDALGMKNVPLLMMGVGYKNPELNRKIHHLDHSVVFGSNKKQPMEIFDYE